MAIRSHFFEATNCVFDISNRNNSFAITTPGYCFSRGGAETIHKSKTLLEIRSQNDIELHVENVRKRGNQIEIGNKDFKLSDLDTQYTK